MQIMNPFRFAAVNILLFVFLNAFTSSPAQAKGELGLKFDLARVSSKIFYSNKTDQELSGDPSKSEQYSAEEIAQKLVDIIEQENLRGSIADDYLSVLIADSSLLHSQGERLRSIIPSLGLDPVRANYYLSKLNSAKQNNEELQTNEKTDPSESAEGVPDFFELVKVAIEKLPDTFGIRNELSAALDVMKQVVVCDPRVTPCTNPPNGSVTGSNAGIIKHMSTEMELDHSLMFESLRYALRLYQHTQQNPAWVDHGIFETTNLNIWNIAMDITHQNPDRSMRVIGTFGHDVCCNSLTSFSNTTKTAIKILNHFRPNSMSSDGNVRDAMYVPGSLPNVKIPSKLLEKFASLSSEYEKINGYKRYYRSGYYHVFGGMLTAQAILKAGYASKNGWKLSTTLSEALGYAYKRYVLESYMSNDAKTLWKAAGRTTMGMKWITKMKFKKWDHSRFAKAKNELETHLAFLELTRIQHKQGADFAFQHYQDQ